MKKRKRTLLPRMLLLLTGGAIINVAVAWGCVFAVLQTVGPRDASISSVGFIELTQDCTTYPDWALHRLGDLDRPYWDDVNRPLRANELPDYVAFSVKGAVSKSLSGWPCSSLISHCYWGQNRFVVPLSMGWGLQNAAYDGLLAHGDRM